MLGSKFGSNASSKSAGHTFKGKAIAKVIGGYLVEAIGLPQNRGFISEETQLRIGAEIIVRVIGQHQGLPLLHPVFAGYR